MASQKDQKERAREARLSAEQAAAAKQARTRRVQMIAGVLVTGVVVIVVLVAISSGGGSKKGGLQTKTQASKTYAAVNKEIGGIPQTGTTLGDPNAKVTLTYYGDLECPICMYFTTGADVDGVTGGLPQFIADQVRTGNAKVEYRSLCTATCGDYSNGSSIFNDQQTAAYAAGQQKRFWDYAELFYHEQGTEGSGYVTEKFLKGIASQITGLNMTKWQTDRGDPALLSQVQTDEKTAQTDGFNATPSFAIQGPKGKRSLGSGVLSYDELSSAVKAVA
jgi:protein-disulfide isomerase